MRPRTLLVLFLAVAGLAAFVWLYERDLPGTAERAQQAKKLFDLKKDDVTALSIERPGQEIRLERMAPAKAPAKAKSGTDAAAPETPAAPEASADWRMTRPRAAVADGLAVGGLVDSLVGLDKERTLEHPDLKALGLDRPQATVRLRTGKGEKVVRFGAKVPTSGEVMVAVEGDPDAYAVADSVLTTLERDPGEWRDKQLFHGDREAIDRISVRGSGGEVLLARRGDAFWIESPPAARDRADRDLVDSLLADLTGMRAERFVDDPQKTPARTLEGMGLMPPKAAIEVVLRGATKPFAVELGGPTGPTPPAQPPPLPTEPGPPPQAPAVYARAGGQVFETVQTNLALAGARSVADWRAKALSGLQVYQVEGAKVTDAAGTLDLSRNGTDWKRGSVTISYTPVSDLLFAVTGSKATRLLSPDEAKALGAPLDKPLLTVAMKGEAKAGSETVTLYPPVAAGVPARASGRDAVLLLAKDQLDNIQKQVAAVRSAPPVKPEKPAKP